MNEPISVVYAYGLDKEEDINILVYDLGSGRADFSILTADEGEVSVIATSINPISTSQTNMGFFPECDNTREKALNEGNLNTYDIQEIVLVGASTKIPRTRKLLKDFFNGKEPRNDDNLDQFVAHGAVIEKLLIKSFHL